MAGDFTDAEKSQIEQALSENFCIETFYLQEPETDENFNNIANRNRYLKRQNRFQHVKPAK